MPFVAVDFSQHDHSSALSDRFDSTMESVDGWLLLLSRLLCLPRARTSNKTLTSIFRTCQTSYFVLLSLSLHAALFLLVLQKQKWFMLTYSSFLVDTWLLLWWNVSGVNSRFRNSLLEATSGVGSVRRKETLSTTNNVSMGLFSLLGLLYLGVLCGSVVADGGEGGGLPSLPSLLPSSFLVVSSTIGVMAMVGCMVLFTTRMAIVSAELRTNAIDYRSDDNVFQTCVTKHYLHIHYNILRVFVSIRGVFSAWSLVQLSLSSLQLCLFARSAWHYSIPEGSSAEVVALAMCRQMAVPLVLPLSRTVFILTANHRLRDSSSFFRHVVIRRICTENRSIHDQVYSSASLFVVESRRSSSSSLFSLPLLFTSLLLFPIAYVFIVHR